MSSEQSPDVKFEIGHVLFIDIVGYSKLLINEHARGLVEARVRERADDKNALIQLAWIDVALNREVEALKLAQRSSELLPPEKDAGGGSIAFGGLAGIESRTGHASAAVKPLH